MKLSKLLSDVLDGQKLVDNAPDKKKEEIEPAQEKELEQQKPALPEAKPKPKPKPKLKPTKSKVKKIAPVVESAPVPPSPTTPEAKQKHDEEIAAKIKAQIKKPTKPVELPAKTMSVPDFAKIRELAKQAKKPIPPVAQEAVLEEAPTKTDASKT